MVHQHGRRSIVLNTTRDFTIRRRNWKEKFQKKNSLEGRTTTLHIYHTFFGHFFGHFLLHDYEVKLPNFTFYGGRKQETTKFNFTSSTWIGILGTQLQGALASF